MALWRKTSNQPDPEASSHPSDTVILSWAGIPLLEKHAGSHFVIVGATGSGKTVCLRLLMQSVLPRITPGSDYRALIYDAKQDFLPVLGGMNIDPGKIRILNPFDRRSYAWDMASDITEPATAQEVASILIEEEKGENVFFSKSARGLLKNVIVALIRQAPGNWSLRDIVNIMSDVDLMRRLLESEDHTKPAIKKYLSADPRTLTNILSTITANMEALEIVAALWHHTENKVSLEDWIRGEYILLLGNDDRLRATLDAINRVIFKRIVQLVNSGTEPTKRRTWIFLDEVKEAGRLDGLSSLLTKSRSKGGRVVLAFQSIEGLRTVYKKHEAEEIAGMPDNKAFLRINDEETAAWASGIIGDQIVDQLKTTETYGRERSTSMAYEEVKREAVLKSEFMHTFPLADDERFYGWFLIPSYGICSEPVEFASELLPPDQTKQEFKNVLLRDKEQQYLPGWDDKDEERIFGKTPPAKITGVTRQNLEEEAKES